MFSEQSIAGATVGVSIWQTNGTKKDLASPKARTPISRRRHSSVSKTGSRNNSAKRLEESAHQKGINPTNEASSSGGDSGAEGGAGRVKASLARKESGSDDYLRKDQIIGGERTGSSGTAATGGSDFAKQGRGALEEEKKEDEAGDGPPVTAPAAVPSKLPSPNERRAHLRARRFHVRPLRTPPARLKSSG